MKMVIGHWIACALHGITVVASLISLGLPGWVTVSDGDGYTEFYGPLIQCSGPEYLSNCLFNDFSCGAPICVKLDFALAFLIVGTVFTIGSLAILIFGTLRAQVSSTTLKVTTVFLQAFTVVSFIVSFAIVAHEYSPYSNNGGYGFKLSFGVSFALTVVSAGLVMIALIVFVVFNTCMKPRSLNTGSFDSATSPLINTIYSGPHSSPSYPMAQIPVQYATPYA
jgi:hypothetical protein